MESENHKSTNAEMDKRHGYEIFKDKVDGKTYFRGASTDWCCFPIEMIPWVNELNRGSK